MVVTVAVIVAVVVAILSVMMVVWQKGMRDEMQKGVTQEAT